MLNVYLFSFLQGIVEGLTEFLPVSSTAHLRISQVLLYDFLHFQTLNENPDTSSYWKMYSVVIQLGAILCLPIYFRERIMKFIRTFPNGERGDRTVWNHPLTLTMIAFVVTAGPGYILHKKIGQNLESLWVMGTAMLVGGIVMWVVDTISSRNFARLDRQLDAKLSGPSAPPTPVTGVAAALNPAAVLVDYESSMDSGNSTGFHRTEHVEEMNVIQAAWIGACQILSAVFPGTSRSMSTIAAGQIAGMSRQSALEFSFLLSIPTMFVATVFEGLKTVGLRKSDGDPINMNMQKWVVLAIGFVVSFFVAWAVVAWFMGWVRKRGFTAFAVYRIIVGTALLLAVWRGLIPTN